MASRTLPWTVAFLIASTPSYVQAQDAGSEELPALQVCIDALKAWRSNWSTIQITARSWNKYDLLESYPDLDVDDPTIGERYYGRDVFVWADWGAIKHELQVVHDGKHLRTSSVGTDGDQLWGADTPNGDPSQLASIQLLKRIDSRPLSTNVVIRPICAIWKSTMGCWLDQRLAEEHFTILRWEEIDGHRCVVARSHRQNGKFRETAWLDPAFGYLPRKFEVTHRPWAPQGVEPPDEWEHGYTWQALEFSRVDGNLVPSRGTFSDSDPPEAKPSEWLIDRVQVNEPLDRPFFSVPKGTPGKTKVTDYVNGKGWRVGSEFESEVKRPIQSSSNSNNVVAGSPDPLPWHWLVMGGLVLLCGSGAITVWHRVNSRSR